MKRREFLKITVPAAIIAPTILNGIPVSAFNGTNALVELALSQQTTVNDNILVIVQLAGGNDGLNTVIPLQYYPEYQNARNNIAIPQNKALTLNGNVGLHPAMTGMQQMYNNGELSIFQSVGYPNPVFSHFRATDILMTASDSNVALQTGWAARYLDVEFPNYPINYPNTQNPHPPAVQIGSVASLEFMGNSASFVYTIPDANSFYNVVSNSAGTVPANNSGVELAYVRLESLQSQNYTSALQTAYNTSITNIASPPVNNKLYEQLKIVANLINGGLKSKIYHVTYGGFDTHDSQVDTTDKTIGHHADLLKTLSDAIGGFNDLLKINNLQDKVLGMTFSEFGRRIKSNASMGTDHGAGAPVFLFGSKVNSGIYGSTPTIPSNVTVNDNVPYQYDFRQIYTSILQQWFCMTPAIANTVLLSNFQVVPIVNGSICGTSNIASLRNEAEKALNIYPNPFANSTTVSFLALDDKTEIEGLNSYGQVVYSISLATKSGIKYDHYINTSSWAVGSYYIRVLSSNEPLVKAITKVQA